MEDADIDVFVEWFQSNGGFVDMQAMGITKFPSSGRGVIALRDIPEGYTLFTLPRALTLSTRTSPLPSLFGFEAWHAHGLHKGWVGLILCMMWEDAWAHELDTMDGGGQGKIQAKWGPYMRTLPPTFDTPMFWSAVELEELQGTAVIDKIGRDDAERAYSEQLVPAIKTSISLFPPSHHEKWYTLEAYHRAGSRILSRSFTVSRWTDDEVDEDGDHSGEEAEGGGNADEAEGPDQINSIESSIYTDDARAHLSSLNGTDERLDSDSEDDENQDSSDVAMVPMADVLNARWGSENAMLFYEPAVLRMVTTRSIKQGEQIFNTYGDPPNSDLLRRYGHIDLVQLHTSSFVPTVDEHGDVKMEDSDTHAETIKHLGNPSDVAEIQADLVVHVVQTTDSALREKDSRERIEWWLDEGEDDVFILGLPDPGSDLFAILPPAFISLTRLLMFSEADFKSVCSKGKLPKGNLKNIDTKESKGVLEIIDEVLKQREEMYVGGSVEDDERLLSITEILTERKRRAVIVRLGEKRILRDARQAVRMTLDELSSASGAGCRNEKGGTRRNKKGGNGGKETAGNKKRVVNETEGNHGRKKARK